MQQNQQDTEKVDSQKFRTFLRNLLQVNKRFTIMMTGSFFELPIQYAATNATDVDFMYIPTDICALPLYMSTPSNFRGTIGTNNIYPGFAKLYAIDGKRLQKPQMNISGKHQTHGPAHTRLVNFRSKFIVNAVVCHHTSSRFNETPLRLSELKADSG